MQRQISNEERLTFILNLDLTLYYLYGVCKNVLLISWAKCIRIDLVEAEFVQGFFNAIKKNQCILFTSFVRIFRHSCVSVTSYNPFSRHDSVSEEIVWNTMGDKYMLRRIYTERKKWGFDAKRMHIQNRPINRRNSCVPTLRHAASMYKRNPHL